MVEFGIILDIIRKEIGITQESFFLRLNSFGTEKTVFSKIVHNKQKLPGFLSEPIGRSTLINNIVDILKDYKSNNSIMEKIIRKLNDSNLSRNDEEELIPSLIDYKTNKDISGFFLELFPVSIIFTNHSISSQIKQVKSEINSFKDIIVVDEQPKEVTSEEIQNFFKGFEATWGCVYNNIPVQRTSYLKKKEILMQKLNGQKKIKPEVNIYTIIGPRGVGKTTMAKQIAVDLVNNGHYAIWVDISKKLEEEVFDNIESIFFKQIKIHIHLFLKVDMYSNDATYENSTLTNLKKIMALIEKRLQISISIYIVIDAMHNAYAFDQISYPIKNHIPVKIELVINMDERELADLIKNLRKYDCLGKLKDRKEGEIFELFTKKSNKILLVSLIESLHAIDEKDNFQAILYREYMSLSEATRIAYPLVALCHSGGISVPSSLLLSALSSLVPNVNIPSILEFLRLHFDGILIEKFDSVTTRHPLIAKTLCNAIIRNAVNRDNFWLQIVHSILKSIVEDNKEHNDFLMEFTAEKIIGLNIKNSESLIDFVDKINEDGYTNLSNKSSSMLLNSIARIFQGKEEYKIAIDIAEKSLEKRNNINNFAKIILGYCYINIRREKNTAKNIAEEILEDEQAWKINKLHAIKIMSMAGFPTDAKYYLDIQSENLSSLSWYPHVNEKVSIAAMKYMDDNETTIIPHYRCSDVLNKWSRGLVTFHEARDLYLDILEEDPFTIDAFVNFSHLSYRTNHLESIITLCNITMNKIENPTEYKIRSNITEKEINLLNSIVLSTKAWALYKNFGSAKADEVNQLLISSLQINENHQWGHYWRGIFLYRENEEVDNAIKEIRHAINLNSSIPPFYFGLAFVIFESSVKKYHWSKINQEVIKLCDAGLKDCIIGGYWGDELNNCLEILKEVALSWKGNKDADADLMTAISSINQLLDFKALAGYF